MTLGKSKAPFLFIFGIWLGEKTFIVRESTISVVGGGMYDVGRCASS